MKNITNTLTKLLAVVIFSVSLNAFSLIPLAPFITISANHVSATVGTAITPVTVTNTGAAASYYSIAPAISNGLSFDAKTGTISGAPIVASDVVTYTVTAVLMTYTMSEVDRHAQDTVTVVIAVGAGTTNLALGKPATQSSTYLYHSIVPVAGYAVDGNTDGYFLNKSTTHTHYEQGAWWQVDLGGEKNIKQIIIHNRTDCCVNRLSNYQVSISNKADFSTHTYQQDFHVAPNPKKIIQLDASGKQGRYVRIQLLDSDYLSLAEVQVMGVDLLRFSEVDYSSSQNDFDGFNNSPNYANKRGFAAIKDDGSIMMWTDPNYGGIPAPSGSGYTKIYSNGYAFATLEADGSITAWGGTNNGGTGAPSDSGYTKIYSTQYAFAALKADGSITAWGYSYWGGATGAPSDNGYTKIYSNAYAFAALKADGSITAWGDASSGGTGAPSDSGYTKIYSTRLAFAALKIDGSITVWGGSGTWGAPSDNGYTKIYSTNDAFAALKADGSITVWGDTNNGGTGAPSGGGYTKIYSTQYAFAALKADGSITAWGYSYWGGTGAPSDNGYTKIYSNAYAFAALKADGSITTWGDIKSGGTNSPNAPTDKGYIKIYSSDSAFAALKADGSITSWGNFDSSWGNFESKHINAAPTDKGYTEIYSNAFAFSAVKPDGSIRAWGDLGYGGAYVSGHNLALGKPATQSSTYRYSDPVAGYAVDGNTDGEFLNKSTSTTEYEQGAWWQVDLGSKKNIKQIIIYNRTDCCADRLSNYQVSISDKADFSTHTYQQDFHVAPDPKKIIQLGISGKRGRYVRVQLLDKNYLSLAEVQVIGVDL
ncbi:galactose-binding domain-containing protein [bacterium endosymbiont of Bathymodiolus sp. 5 South]|uniref:galactose-binding domain-containing protein n=1 Tax=bacterium endosymbiont of Bathymodiolus sp. 5 South TaxID=1181670 RepID=UPI0010B3D9A9|nr:discoidin domain-containing protein [bacterium endosymbiont of Bathymodiolus sp. 5 South]SHN92673.1 Late competence protein ComGC, access of DNA to ComEA, FIG007487 [bacterium endosymbiont of Bathymodiolus sp. 5 South]